VIASHRVADPHWAVAHVLQYGTEAEVVGPEEVRAVVRSVTERLTA
jgi:predicted DNA-binding transcriptional regulator YafY